MQCNRFKAVLPDFLDGVLPKPLQKELAAHAAVCSHCRKEMEEHRRIEKKLIAMGIAPLPASLHDKIMAEVSKIPGLNPRPGANTTSAGIGLKLSAGVIIGALIIVCAGIYLSLPLLSPVEIPTKPDALNDINTGRRSEALTVDKVKPDETELNREQTIKLPPKDSFVAAVTSVAAADSGETAKFNARFVCRGKNDENQINAAFNKLGSRGGVVELEAGTYHCSRSFAIPASIILRGKGKGKTILKFDSKELKYSLLVARPNIEMQDFTISGPWIHILASDVKIIGVNHVP